MQLSNLGAGGVEVTVTVFLVSSKKVILCVYNI